MSQWSITYIDTSRVIIPRAAAAMATASLTVYTVGDSQKRRGTSAFYDTLTSYRYSYEVQMASIV